MSRTLISTPAGALLLSLAVPAMTVGQTPADEWRRIDALKPASKIVMTLRTGERRIGRFAGATTDTVTLGDPDPGGQVSQPQVLRKADIARVTTYDPPNDGAKRGALAGAGVMVALLAMDLRGCQVGCEASGGLLAWGLIGGLTGAAGAGIGAVLGHLADGYAGDAEELYPTSRGSAAPASAGGNRFFPPRPNVRVGMAQTQTRFVSPLVTGRASGRAVTATWQVSPYVSAHVEYTAPTGRFDSTPGSVPDSILQNLMSAPPNRGAGMRQGIESRRVKFVFSEFLGFHPPPWGRVRVEALAGLGVQAQETRDYFPQRDAKTGVLTGKHYVLNFETPKNGIVLGVNAEVAVVRGLSIVPTFRYNRMGDPGPSTAVGVGAHWRF